MSDPATPTGSQAPLAIPASLWRFGGLSLWRVALKTVAGYRNNQLAARSAQFAYYSILALAPLLIVVIAGVAQLPLKGVMESFLRAVDVGMPGNVVGLFEDQVRDIQAKSTTGLILGAVVVLGIAGSKLFLTIGAGLDAAFGVERRRRFGRAGAMSLAMTFGVALLLLIAMVLLLVGPKLAGPITRLIDLPWVHVLCSVGVRWGVACGFMLLATSVIYWLIPGTKVRWHALSPGSLFATIGWVGVTQGFRIYVENFARYNETYGALGGVVVLLVWLYLTGSLLLAGGQINAVIHRAAEEI